jgi:hypothetical protein
MVIDSYVSSSGGVTASTWVLKHKEHSGAHGDLVKNVQLVFGNEYQLAA